MHPSVHHLLSFLGCLFNMFVDRFQYQSLRLFASIQEVITEAVLRTAIDLITENLLAASLSLTHIRCLVF